MANSVTKPPPPPSPIFNYSPLRYSPTPPPHLPVPDIDERNASPSHHSNHSPTKPHTVEISRKEWRESLSTIIRPTPRYVSLQAATPDPTPLHWRRAISTPHALSEDDPETPLRHLLSPTAGAESPDGIISNFFDSPQHQPRFGAASTPGWLPPSPNAPIASRPPIMIARRRPENQDCYCVYSPFPSPPASASARRTQTADSTQATQPNADVLLALFDGHGDAGRRIAHFTRAFLVEALSCATQGFYKALLSGVASGTNVSLATAIHSRRWRMFIDAFEATDKSLRAPTSRSAYGDSGTTAVVAFLSGWDLYVAWVGHSRCVVGKRVNGVERHGSFAAVDMSRDHTTNSGAEMKRIRNEAKRVGKKKRHGSVEFLRRNSAERQDEARVTRSLGDKSGNQFGCISEPEVTYRHLGEEDRFIMVGSNGVWAVLTNQDAVNIVGRKKNSGASAEGAAAEVVREAKRRWRRKCCKAQDITAVVMWLGEGKVKEGGRERQKGGFKASLKRMSRRFSFRKGAEGGAEVFSVGCDGSLKVFCGET